MKTNSLGKVIVCLTMHSPGDRKCGLLEVLIDVLWFIRRSDCAG